MAKKKSTTTASAKSPKAALPPSAIGKSTATTSKALAKKKLDESSANKPSANGTPAASATMLGKHQIGDTAGAVWLLLTGKGETSLATVKKEIDAPADLILAAVGWLAREEKLEFTGKGKTTKLALK